ncbi:MAG: hypothetical protein RLZZ155_1161 [Bacteroidota bacterium]|jgi:hypothetical protein
MEWKSRCLLFFLFGWKGISLFAQEETNALVEQRIETISSFMEDGSDVDYSSLTEDLIYFARHPINLNTADALTLQSLFVLNDMQIHALLKHIDYYGRLKSIFELQSIRGMDLPTVSWIQPFVYVNEEDGFSDFSFRRLREEGTHDLMLRSKRTLQEQAGFVADPITGEKNFLGSEYGSYMRYRFQYRRNILVGMTFENDIGEPLRNGPDFRSASLFIREAKALKQLVIGDYQVQFGQGLTCWNSMAFGKSSFSVQVKRNAQGLKPYSSVNESSFFRGVGITLGNKFISATAFASRRKLDASFNTDSVIADDESAVSSILLGGLHRTESEIAKKNVLTEIVAGGNIFVQRGMWKLGTVAVQRSLSDSIAARTDWYAQGKFAGKIQRAVGMYAEGVWQNVSLFGEVSRSSNNAYAYVAGFTAAIHSRVSATVLFRNFDQDFQSVYSNVIAEGSSVFPSNEWGMYVSVQAQLSKKISVNAYSDGVQYPWLRYQVTAPSSFSDHVVQFNYKPDKKHEFYARVRVRRTSVDHNELNRIDFPVDKLSEQIRLNFIFSPTESLKLHSRLEFVKTNEEGLPTENGYLVFQDVIWKKMGVPCTITFRYALFQTDAWNARLYAYENDVLYSYSIPAYYGKGARIYGIFKFDIRRNIDLWIRIAQWTYTDRDQISSGDSAIDGFRKTDCTAQLRVQF